MINNKKLRGNFFALFTLYVTNYILPFLTIPYLSRLLSVEHYGVILYATSFTVYLTMVCEYGFNYIGVKEVVLLRNNKQSLDHLVSAITFVKFLLFLLSLVVTIIVVSCITKFTMYWYIYIISVLSLVNNVLFPTWFFRGMEEMWHITIIGALMKIISVMGVLLIIHRDSQFVFIPIITSSAAIVSAIVAQVILYKKFAIRYKIPSTRLVIDQVKEGWYIFVSNAALSLYSTANAFFLGLLSNPVAVAFYVAAEKILIACFDCIAILSQVVFPHIVKQFSESKKVAIKLLQRNFYFFIVVGCFASSVLFVGSDLIISLIFSDKYTNSVLVLRILSVLPLVVSMSNVLGSQTMIPLNMNKQYTTILTISGLLNLVLIFLLVPYYSYVGSAYCVVITEIFNLCLMVGFLAYKKIYVWSGTIN